MEYNLTKEYAYKDIMLIPKRCVVKSRSECDTSCKLGNYTFKSPVICANMPSVVTDETCKFLAENGWFYINHRFNKTKEDYANFIEIMNSLGHVSSISVGVNEDSYEILNYLYDKGLSPNFCTIDIANGFSYKTKEMIVFLKDKFPYTFVIAGNVCTAEAVSFLENSGADAIKVGIAGGKSCITKYKTGFHRPMVSTIIDCIKSTRIPIIADGGIENHGDIAKALSFGSHMVMVGFLFSGFNQSAGELITLNDKTYKAYYGSASQYNKKEYKHIEGTKLLVEYKGDMMLFLKEIIEDLKSSISYAGGINLSALLTVEKILLT